MGRTGERERFWREHCSRQATSGLGVRAYCDLHGLAEPTFYQWRRKLRKQQASHARDSSDAQDVNTTARRSFIELKLDAPQAAARGCDWLEIVLPDGTLIRVPPNAERAALDRALAALRAAETRQLGDARQLAAPCGTRSC